MIVERTSSEIILRLSADVDVTGLQRIVNYLKYKEAIRNSEAKEQEISDLANKSKRKWWQENKHCFIK